jgi:hypothetical protein
LDTYAKTRGIERKRLQVERGLKAFLRANGCRSAKARRKAFEIGVSADLGKGR